MYILSIISLPTTGEQPSYGGGRSFDRLRNLSVPLEQGVNKVSVREQQSKPEHGQQTKPTHAIAAIEERKTRNQQTKDRRTQARNK